MGLPASLGLMPVLCHSRPHRAMAGPPGLKPLVAVGQVTSTPDKELNFAACAGLVREAAGRGACLVFLPEGFDYIGADTAQTLSLAEGLDGDLMGRYAALARYRGAPGPAEPGGGEGDLRVTPGPPCPQGLRRVALSGRLPRARPGLAHHAAHLQLPRAAGPRR